MCTNVQARNNENPGSERNLAVLNRKPTVGSVMFKKFAPQICRKEAVLGPAAPQGWPLYFLCNAFERRKLELEQ